MTKSETIILGIDPGTIVMGYGVISVLNKKVELLSMGAVSVGKYDSHPKRLKTIFERTTYLVDEYKPDYCALEAPFYGKNVQSMLKLGRAQGVCMAAALQRDVPVVEYSPKKVKQAITGNGNASKEQVLAMLKQTIKFTETPKLLDASDGLAVAICHYYDLISPLGGKTKNNSWESFIKNNPGRVKGNK